MEIKEKLFDYINAHLSEKDKESFKEVGMGPVESLLEIIARFIEEKHYEGFKIIHYEFEDEDKVDILELLKEMKEDE